MQSRRIGSSAAVVVSIGLVVAGIYVVASDLAAPRWMVWGWVVLSFLAAWFCYRYVRLRAVTAASVARTAALRMHPADAAWLHLDEPNNPADIVLLMTFDEAPTLEAVQATVTERLLRFDRFRQRIVDIAGQPYWENDADFALENHVSRNDVAGPLTAERLAGVVAELGTGEMAPERPLWSLHVVAGTDGRGAVVLRVHHCIADGFALAHAVAFPARSAGEPTAAAAGPKPAVKPAGRATDLARTLGHLLRAPFGRDTVVRGHPRGRRRMAWSNGFSLDTVKGVARSRGASLNDVFMSAVTGALRRFLAERGELADGRSIRAIVPVNLRPARWVEEADDALGNRFGLFFIDLPVEEQTTQARSSSVEERMRAGNRLAEASVTLGMLQALGRGPARLERLVSHLVARKASVVISNVPGPRTPVRFGGEEIRDVMFWAPHPGKVGMALSMLTYAGTVRMGARTDEGIVDDPRRIVELFEAELSVMLAHSRVVRAASSAAR